MRTAKGDFAFEIYVGKVSFDGQEIEIPVHVGNELSEILLGRQWLKNYRLVIDLPLQVITLERSSPS
jgi:predicted aspartyl protease